MCRVILHSARGLAALGQGGNRLTVRTRTRHLRGSRRFLAATTAVVLAGALLGACGDDEDEAESTSTTTAAAAEDTTTTAPREITKVKVGSPTAGWAATPYYFGQEKGIFAEEGLEVEVTVAQSNILRSAAIAGEIPYSSSLATAVQDSITSPEGSPLQIILVTTGVPLFDVIARPDVQSFEDIKGKPFGVNSVGEGSNLAAIQHLEAAGLEADDVTFVGLGAPPNIYGALQAGTVTAAVLSPPVNLLAIDAGFTRLAEGPDLQPEAIGGLAVTPDYLESHRDEAQRLIRGVLASIEYMRDNRAEVETWMQTFYKLPADKPEMAEMAYELTMSCFTEDGRISDGDLQAQIERVAAASDVDNPDVDLEKLFDLSLLEELS